MTTHPFPPFWFIFDVESIGLHGEAFAVAAQVFDHNGRPLQLEGGWWHHTEPGAARGITGDHEWIRKNVPEMKGPLETRREVRNFFWDQWEHEKAARPGIVMAAECAWPVEARFLIECIEDEPELRRWSGPYPLHDIASIMLAAGMDPMATYERVNPEYPPHHPLGDVQHSAHCLAMALERLRANAALADAHNELE